MNRQKWMDTQNSRVPLEPSQVGGIRWSRLCFVEPLYPGPLLSHNTKTMSPHRLLLLSGMTLL